MTYYSRTCCALVTLLMLFGLSTQASWAGKPSCKGCGSHQHLKKVCQLVSICKPVEMPTYACTKMQTFFPDKGMLGYQQFRCDIFCRLHKTCNCSHGKGGGIPTLSCCCRTECGCKTMYGAKSTGCHLGTCIKQTQGSTVTRLPVLKWVTSYVCEDCCAVGKPHAK